MELKVTLPTHQYTLKIGENLLSSLGSWVAELWSKQKVMIITDRNVSELYGQQVIESLQASGFEVGLYAIEPGEASKSLANAEKLYEWLAAEEMTRKDGIIALGGGVVGDLAGFVASTYMRGLHFLQVPTTLLAQVDSSIGGKTAVNSSVAKNLIGTFAQPDGVLIDTATLKTLEPRRVQEGIAEIVKSAAIADIALWQLLESFSSTAELLAHSTEVIEACCRVKRGVVETDETDTGQRLILNFGHTIGHAIENTSGYGVVTHGEAVAIGMVQISQVAESKGIMPQGITAQLKEMLVKFSLPTRAENWQPEQLFKAITHDKKAGGSQIKIILLSELGKAKIVELATAEMVDYLKRGE